MGYNVVTRDDIHLLLTKPCVVYVIAQNNNCDDLNQTETEWRKKMAAIFI
jgi:hypothetical protein